MDIDSYPDDFQQKIAEIDRNSISPELGKILDSPSYYLRRAKYSHDKKLRELLVDFGLNQMEFELLVRLMAMTKSGEVVAQTNLANLFKYDKMMVSKALRALEKKGLAVRGKHPRDSRAKSLVVTAKGLAIVDEILKVVVKFDEEYFSALDNKDEFIRQLKKIL